MNANPVKIVLSGYYGFGNVGDEALLEVIASQIKTRFPLGEITVLSNTPEATARAYGVRSILRTDLRAINAATRECDAFLSGGGGLLQNATSLRSLMYYAGVLNAAIRLRRKTMIFAQSIGPLDALGRRIVTQFCRRVSIAAVRDGRSHEALVRLLGDARVERTADPVFLYEPHEEPDPAIMRGLDAQGAGYVAIAVRRSSQTEKIAASVAQAVDRLAARHGLTSVFLPLGGPQDAETATAIICKCRSHPVLLPEANLATTWALIGQARAVVGMRLHALIIAARLGVPFAALAYDPKVAALLEDLEYPAPPIWDAEKKSPVPDGSAVADALIDDHARLAASLAESGPRMRAAAARNFELLEELLAGAPKRPAAAR